MSIENCECSDASIESILSLGADSLVSEKVAHHVATCRKCQYRLEVMAADADEWKQAKQLLTGFGRIETRRSSRGSVRTQPWIESMAKQILAPASHPEMLGRIGRYEVDRLIGSGGMGIVFKAIDTELNRPVAIKVLAPYLANLGAARQRFAREAKAAAAVVHEHVVPIHTVESEGESPYLVMHYVAGESLQARLDREGALELREILRIGTQVASGLAAAHSQGLIHRDIKPSNILLEQSVERSLITDFGLARSADDASLTNTGYHAGTPQYMSPEQARGDAIDSRSDLFSFGSMLYTMCTGRAPFRAETAYGTLRKITDTEAHDIREQNPDIPDWLCRIIHQLMSKDVNQRYQSAEGVASLLAECLAHVQQPTTHPIPFSLRNNPKGSNKQKMVAYSVLVIVAIAGLFAIPAWNGLLVHGPSPNRTTELSKANQVSDQRQSLPSPEYKGGEIVGTRQTPRIAKPLKLAMDPSDVIRDALRKTIEIQCVDQPLEDVLKQFAERVGIEVDIRRADFFDSNVDLKSTLSLKAKGPASEILHRICSRMKLGYIAHESNLEVASLAYVQMHPVTRFYDCAHILPNSQLLPSVVYTIEKCIEPSQWQSAGGQGTISIIESALVVRATEIMHQQIEQLLARVGASQESTMAAQQTHFKSIP